MAAAVVAGGGEVGLVGNRWDCQGWALVGREDEKKKRRKKRKKKKNKRRSVKKKKPISSGSPGSPGSSRMAFHITTLRIATATTGQNKIKNMKY